MPVMKSLFFFQDEISHIVNAKHADEMHVLNSSDIDHDIKCQALVIAKQNMSHRINNELLVKNKRQTTHYIDAIKWRLATF